MIERLANQPARNLPLQFFRAGKKAAVRTAEADRNAKRLRFAANDVSSGFAGSLQQPKAHRFGNNDDEQGSGFVRGVGQLLQFFDAAEKVRRLHDDCANVFAEISQRFRLQCAGRFVERRLGDDTARQNRVLAARLPISFARAERAKTDSLALLEILGDAPEQSRRGLQLFVDGCKAAGFRNLHENRYPPEAYMEDYLNFIEKQRAAAGSRAHSPVLATPASATYAKGDPQELTNRRIGETDYRYNWLGFQGNDLQVTVQLQGDSCSEIRVSFLQDQQSWVFFPKRVVFEVSEDGVHFRQVHAEDFDIMPDGKKSTKTAGASLAVAPAGEKIRFVRVTAVNTGTCPTWHTCNGNPCWIFADEVVVR